ncbi:MAG: hypothetical protein ACYDDI_16785 [Candidatus Acidiferrales bacterium]
MDVFGGPCWWKARASVRWRRSLGSHARPYARCCGIRFRRERPVKRPKLGPWIGVIDAILKEDKNNPVKQRHTAKRIFDRLRQEYAYTVLPVSSAGLLLPAPDQASVESCARKHHSAASPKLPIFSVGSFRPGSLKFAADYSCGVRGLTISESR